MNPFRRITANRSAASTMREIVSSGVRDPSAATTSLQYTSPGLPQLSEWDADSAVRDAYLSSVIVFACIRTRAMAFAGCPLRAVLPGQPIEKHNPEAPLARLLGPAPFGPNPTMSSRALWANAIANRIVTGKLAWELEKPQGATGDDWTPVGIWLLIARAFRPIPSKKGMQLFTGYRYGTVPSRMVDLSLSQVFYSFIPSLNDPRQAFSPLQPLRYDITSDVLQSVYDVAFLRNDARPAGVIISRAFEEDEERRAFRQQFDAEHRGPWNANKQAFAEVESGSSGPSNPDLQWVQVGMTQRDAQMLITHQDKVRRISMGLSVPMSLLDASGRTFSNAGMEERSFWLDTMLPDLHDMADEINLKLAPRLGPEIAVFDTRHVAALENPVKWTSMSLGEAVDRKVITPDQAAQALGFEYSPELADDSGAGLLERAQAYAALISGGYDADTAATIVGIDPPSKDDALPSSVEVALVTAGWDPAIAKAIASGDAENMPAPPVAAPTLPPVVQPAQASAEASLRLLSATLHVRAVNQRQQQRARAWRAANAQAIGFEAVWRKAMRRLFQKQRAATLKRLNERKGRWAKALEKRDASGEDWTGEVFDKDFWAGATQEEARILIESIYAAVGSRVTGQLGAGFDVNSPEVLSQIDMRASKLAEQVTSTTYDAIRSVILSGIENGSGIPTIADGVEAVFNQADAQRAELIARTESLAATNDAALAGYDQAAADGLIDPNSQGKVWIATPDERECDDCEALDGEVVALDDTFSSGDDAPPGHPGCRCAISVEDLDQSERSMNPQAAAIVLQAIAHGQITAHEVAA